MTILVVDAANVVGSVPDGWWRDRAGAAARLHAELAAASLPFDRIVVVLEGQARAGVPPTPDAAVTVVHAPASGDDEIVRQCHDLAATGATVTLASADRGLLARAASLGVEVMGPKALRESLG